MKVSLISTVKNEAHNADYFMRSVYNQTRKPDEIIIIDAGSSDETMNILRKWYVMLPQLKIITSPDCTRSAGRNMAISIAVGEVIAATDFGCTLKENWLEEIVSPIMSNNYDVTAGYYCSSSKNIIQYANSFFTHPALFEIDPNSFLPSTRSMAFKKKCWEHVGGFDEKLVYAEDTKFSLKLREQKFSIFFNDKAIVVWNSEPSVFKMMRKLFLYSYWDGRGGLVETGYYKKIIKIMTVFLLFIASVLFYYVFYLFAAGVGLYQLKTYLKSIKKGLNIFSSLLVLLLKPLYDITQAVGFVLGKLIGKV